VLKGLFLSVEKWASENDERSTLLVILIGLAFVFVVFVVVGMMVLIMPQPSAWPF
jgi:uncharacterized membrane protein YqjE